MARRYFMFVMMTFGGSMVIATLLAAVRNRGAETWAMAGCRDSVSGVSCWGRVKDFGIDVVSTEKAEQDTVIFSKEQFYAGLRRCLCRVVQGIPPFHQDSTNLHSPQYRPHVRAPALPSIVTELPDSTNGGAKRHVMVRGAWAGSRHPVRPFSPNYSLAIPGPEKKGYLVDWVEMRLLPISASVLKIDAKERQCKMLLTARNLMAVVQEPQEYVINILPRKMPKEVVPGEHYIVKDLPIYQALKEADAEKRRALLDNQEKKKNEGTPSEGSQTEMRRRLSRQIKLQRKRRSCCIHQPSGLPNPDVDAVEAVCADPMEEAGIESQSQPSDDPDRLTLVLVKGHLRRGRARRAIRGPDSSGGFKIVTRDRS
ncbi:hypothetical protein CK203_114158 [Vitis vinifera]|uniref:Uncharacterized protein n=1 Tax=Vitis vinifera TaxID=29760 RepID=A0A438F8P9_VITVI|nr:hypothetical protein CK203_114158 [Vitis vinifera]